jgi:hypothetical protein
MRSASSSSGSIRKRLLPYVLRTGGGRMMAADASRTAGIAGASFLGAVDSLPLPSGANERALRDIEVVAGWC